MRLRLAVMWAMLGNVVYAACQWGYILVLAKFSSAENVGYYAFAQAIIYPIFAFMNLQLRRLQVTDQNQQVSFYSYLCFAFCSGFFALVCSLAIGFVTEDEFTIFLPVVTALGCAKLFETLSDVCYGKCQQRGDMKTVTISLIFRSAMGLGVFTALILNQQPLWLACLGMSVCWLLIFSVYDQWMVRQYLDMHFDTLMTGQQIKKIVKLGLPLGILILLNQVHLNVPRYILKMESGMVEVGIYAAIASLITIGNILISSIGQALLPDMSKCYSEGRMPRFRKLFLIMFGVALVVGGGAVAASYWAGSDILVLLYSREYYDKQQVLIWVMLAGAVWYLSGVSGTALTAARRFVSQAWLTSLVVLTTVGACMWLIPGSGSVGAAQALFIGASVKFLIQGFQILILILTPLKKS